MNETVNMIFTLIFGLVLGVVLLFITYKICLKIFSNGERDAILNNSALAIIIASIFISAGFVVSGIIDPLVHTIETLNSQGIVGKDFALQAVYYTILFSSMALMISLAASVIGFKAFDLITKDINEASEIKNGNNNVAIIGGAIIFVLSLFIKFGVIQLIESFIPYPNTPIF